MKNGIIKILNTVSLNVKVLPILSVLVVLLSRFKEDIRVDKDLAWARDRTIAGLFEANCCFPI